MQNRIAYILVAIVLSFAGHYSNAASLTPFEQTSSSSPVELVESVALEVKDIGTQMANAFGAFLSQMKTVPQAIVDSTKSVFKDEAASSSFDSIEELLAFVKPSV